MKANREGKVGSAIHVDGEILRNILHKLDAEINSFEIVEPWEGMQRIHQKSLLTSVGEERCQLAESLQVR